MTCTRIFLLSVASALFCACSGGDSSKNPMDFSRNPKDFNLTFGGSGWVFTVKLNGIPVRWNEQGGGSKKLTPAVRNGENTLSIKASKCKRGLIEPFRIRVGSSPAGHLSAETPIIEFEVTPDDVGDVYEKSVSFNAEIPMKWMWQDADTIASLTNADHQAILLQIRTLSAALTAKDLGTYFRLHEAALTDAAKYYGMTREDLIAQEEKRLRDILTEDARVEMREEAALAFVPLGHVVYVHGPADETRLPTDNWIIRVLQKNSKNRFWSFGPFLFARVKGNWRIVNR